MQATVPTQADIVVIGAGAFGLSAAWHLAKLGAGRVVVLDRFAPGSQTSPRAAGLFKRVQTDETRTRVMELSIEKVLRFEQNTGVPLDVERSGSLLLARTPEHAAFLRHEAERSREWDVELEMVDNAEARRLAPYLDPSDVLAACYIPGDVYIEEPAALLRAWLAALDLLSLPVLDNTRVTGIRTKDGAVRGVVTERGNIETECVLDAAGAWARIVGALAGSEVPVVPVRHQLYITDPLPGIPADYPILRIIDSAVYARPARGGLMLGRFEPDPLPVDVRSQPDDFTIADTPLDFAVLERATATVERAIPIVRDSTVAEHRGGLFTMTADGRFLTGPVPGIRGLWAASGCNGSGFSNAPALGQLLAEWIIEGSPSIDLASLSPERFAGNPPDDERLVRDCVWQYANYYGPGV
jgi:glycine/D-amino acid oxidase-like deaminating enzyme